MIMDKVKVNIIHLHSNFQRLDLLKQELLTQNITDYELWAGIVSEPTPRQNIAKAHKQIVLDAKERGLNEVCIMEDDCHFPAPNGFEYFLSKKPEVYDLYLSGIYTGSKKMKDEHLPPVFSGLHLYLIHSKFYDTFLNIDTSNQDLDSALSGMFRQGKINVVCIFPFAAIQHEVRSNNSGCIFRHKQFFSNSNVYGFK